MSYLVRPSLFDEILTRGGASSPLTRSFVEPLVVRSENAGVTPKLNVYEDSYNYYVMGLFPGLNADQLDVSVKENVLTISGEYNFGNCPEIVPAEGENNTPQYRTLVSELPQGKFTRQIKFAAALNFDKIDSSFENGLLKLTLPKAESNQPRKISLTKQA